MKTEVDRCEERERCKERERDRYEDRCKPIQIGQIETDRLVDRDMNRLKHRNTYEQTEIDGIHRC